MFSGVVTVAVVVWASAPYDWQDLYYRDVGIPSMQASHGFGWGPVTFECPGSASQTFQGVVSVVSGGPLERLGIRPGDVPFEYHGNAYAFLHSALEAASRGHFTTLGVLNAHDCRRGGNGFRTVALHPKVHEVPVALSAGLLPSPLGTVAVGATPPARPEGPHAAWLIDLQKGSKRELWSYRFAAKAAWSADGKRLAITHDFAPSRCVLLDVAGGTASNPIERVSALPAAARPAVLHHRLACEIVGWLRDEPARVGLTVFDLSASRGERWRFDYFFDVETGDLVPAGSR